MSAIGGAPQPPKEPAAAPLLRAARNVPQAHDALIIVGREALTWSELYLLFELFESDVGSKMFDRVWISPADAELFARTANSYTTLRSAGRHGKDRGAPPASPMSHSAAVVLVRALVFSWLQALGASDAQNLTA